MPLACPSPARFLRAVGVVALVAGCSRGEFKNLKQPTFPVTGEVRLDGKPLAGATIVFKPVDTTKFKWREQPQATSNGEGRFTVFTYSTGDGAPVGEYRVGIAVLGAGDDEGGDQVRRDTRAAKVPPRYATAETSGLSARVEPKPNVLVPFELSSR